MNTQPTFTKPWFRMLPDQPIKPVRDDDSFGLAAIDRREKIRTREREKKRRQRHLQALRQKIDAPAMAPVLGEVFETASGILAYRKFMPNLVKLGEAMSAKGEGTNISLPWISILGASERTA
ncbi:hypothetical protein [Mesorhizobium sp. A556]